MCDYDWLELAHAQHENDQLLTKLRDVYRERAQLVAFLASRYPSTVSADPENFGWVIVYVETPAGQMSWHISPDCLDLFDHVEPGSVEWDGHTTEQKYERLVKLREMR